MLLRGNKVAERNAVIIQTPLPTPPPPPPLTSVPLQVVKVKNSRGGQEGSGGPGATAAPSPQTRLPLLFRNLGEVLGCEQRNPVRGGQKHNISRTDAVKCAENGAKTN